MASARSILVHSPVANNTARAVGSGTLMLLLVMSGALAVTAATDGLIQVCAFTCLVALGASWNAKEITHPLTWFGPIFWLYSAAFPMLALVGIYEYDRNVQFAMTLHAVAFISFSLPLLTCSTPLRTQHWNPRAMALRKDVAAVLLLLLLPVVAILVSRVSSLGAASKRELIDLNSGVVSVLISALTMMTFAFCMYLTCAISRRDRVWPIASITLVCFAVTIVMLGERDYLLRAIVITVLIVWDFYRRPKFPTIALLGLLVLMALPWLQLKSPRFFESFRSRGWG